MARAGGGAAEPAARAVRAEQRVNAPRQCKACRKGSTEQARLILYDGYCYDCLVDRVADIIESGALRKAWQEESQAWPHPRTVNKGQ